MWNVTASERKSRRKKGDDGHTERERERERERRRVSGKNVAEGNEGEIRRRQMRGAKSGREREKDKRGTEKQ